MNKSDLVEALASETLIPQNQAEGVVNAFFDTIADGLMAEGRAELRGFGSFRLKEYPGYRGRNPRTGAVIDVKPKRLPAFKAGRELKALVDNGAPAGQ